MRVHARLSFIKTTNLPSFVTLIRCFIGRSKPLGRFEEFGQAVFLKEVKIQRSPGTPSLCLAKSMALSSVIEKSFDGFQSRMGANGHNPRPEFSVCLNAAVLELWIEQALYSRTDHLVLPKAQGYHADLS
jgi:hypothetical protein